MKNDVQWLKLDNSGKLFPMLRYRDYQNIFSISVELTNLINPELIESCINTTLERFPSFKVSLKRGAYWYYFERNSRPFRIVPEDDILMRHMGPEDNNGYPFRITYHESRISFEMYHCVADGAGLIEFIKSLLVTYLTTLGHVMSDCDNILTVDSPIDAKEYEDSFKTYYKKMRIRDMTVSKMTGMTSVYKASGKLFENEGKGVILGKCKTSEIIALCKKNGCSVTEYLCGLYMYSIYMAKGRHEDNPARLVVFIPMNLRRLYDSVTLRNFSLFARASLPQNNKDITLIDFINCVKASLKEELQLSEIDKNISTAVRAEKLIAMRVLPLFMKKMIFKITNFANKVKPTKTSSFSNLGAIVLPESIRKHIIDFNFSLRSSANIPIALSMVSCYDSMSICITRNLIDTTIEKFFFSSLAELGINLTMTSNYWEVEDVL